MFYFDQNLSKIVVFINVNRYLNNEFCLIKESPSVI